MPNAERLNKVADMIQAFPEHFDMGAFLDGPDYKRNGTVTAVLSAPLTSPQGCGTTACIAGWACHLWAAEVNEDEGFPANAARILGLNDEQADVFWRYSLNTADKAADLLRRMALDAEWSA